MKKYFDYKSYLMIAIAGLFFSACSDKLDIEPRQSIGENVALTDYTGVQNALIGAWDALQHPDFLGANFVMNAELMSGNIYWGGSFTNFSDIADKRILPNNASTQPFWMQGYQAIDRANKIIDVVKEGNISEPVYLENKDRILGNALVIRAISHFELVRVFGQPPGFTSDNSHLGVPVITRGTYIPADAEFVSRETVANVYSQVIKDLEDAAELLPANAVKPFPSTHTANALLARVYLENRDWEKAAELSLEVINSEVYSLNESPVSFYSSAFSSESILEIAHTESDNPRNTRADLANYWSPYERADISVPPSVLEIFEESDQRKNLYFNIDSDETIEWFSNKYSNQSDNVPYFRYAEILLIRAEAMAMLNPDIVPEEAVDLLGIIRERSNAGHAIPETPEELLAAIMLEREKELKHEGSLFYDLKRWRRDDVGFSRAGNQDFISWDDSRMIYPIPQREMDVNPNLDQNPGY